MRLQTEERESDRAWSWRQRLQLRVKIDRSIKSYHRPASAAPRKRTRTPTVPKIVMKGQSCLRTFPSARVSYRPIRATFQKHFWYFVAMYGARGVSRPHSSQRGSKF